jgi:hypothetical protein
VGYELLRLLQFVELNLTGLRKILKKFEKNLGVRVMEQYVSSRGQGPYSQLQQLFRTAVSQTKKERERKNNEKKGKIENEKEKIVMFKYIEDTFYKVRCLSELLSSNELYECVSSRI